MILDEKEFLFIIGAPRSGTTWLQLMLGAHPSVCTTVELTLFIYTNRWIFRWNREKADIEADRWHIGLPMVWSEKEFYGFLEEFLERAYKPIIDAQPDATHILDKHPTNAAFVEEMNSLVPNSRFIHIIRDGRDVAASMVAAKKQMGFGTGTVSESAAAWKHHVEWAQNARQFDGRYLEIRYKDLQDDPVSVMRNAFDFCGLEISDEDLIANVEQHAFKKVKQKRLSPEKGVALPKNFYRKGKVGSWQEEFSSVDCYLFDEIAGDLLVELGYAEPGWWADSSTKRWSLPLKVALSSRTRLRQSLKGSVKRVLKPASQGA